MVLRGWVVGILHEHHCRHAKGQEAKRSGVSQSHLSRRGTVDSVNQGRLDCVGFTCRDLCAEARALLLNPRSNANGVVNIMS
jgi:hypothetical protein